MGVVHTFDRSKVTSDAASDLPIWLPLYRSVFGEVVSCIDHRQNGDHQDAGIDRTLVLANGKTVWVDEKVRQRSRNGRVYDDVLLEFVSNDQRNTPGWVCKQLLCHWVAYVNLPAGKAYLLPVEPLQQAWRRHCDDWKRDYGICRAPNGRYESLNVPVPVRTLFPAIGASLRPEFDPVETL